MTRFKPLLLSVCLLAGLLFVDRIGPASAETASPEVATQYVASPNAAVSSALTGAEQRVALVIGNSGYQNAPALANAARDAQSMAQFLNSAGFEVVAATDVTQNEMIEVVQNFSSRIAAHGSNTVAMIYYAGHGVQLEGENYLIPIDAKVSTESDLVNNSLRLVDVLATLQSIPSRMRIVVLDACRNNPFPNVNDVTRGLAIADAPNGSIIGYSTAPGTEALDGDGGHSPYASAFLHLARQPNLPIEQLFKRIRLEVNGSTDGQQTPWEISALHSDFYFFGDTAVAATHPPVRNAVVQAASNLPSRSVREMYDFVVAEGSPEYYREFIQFFPNDPLADRIRLLLGNLEQATAWHSAVLANSPFVYKAFYEKYATSPYAQTALKLESHLKLVPVLQPTHIIAPSQPMSKLTNPGLLNSNAGMLMNSRKIMTLPVPATNTTPKANGISKIVTLPGGTAERTGSNRDPKANHIVDAPRGNRNGEGLKLNNSPARGSRLSGGYEADRTSRFTPARSNFRFAGMQSGGMGMGTGMGRGRFR